MRRIFLYIYLILYATALVGANDTLTIGSGAEGKGYYNLALSIKKVLEDNNFSKNIIVKATNGSANNLEFLQKGEIELAIVQSDTAFYAQNGLNKFRSNPITNISTVIDFYQEPIYIVTNKEDIHSLEALKNLNVNFGLLNSGLAESAKVIFNAEGILDSIYATHQPENDAIKSLEEGNLNAFLTNAITPEVQKKLKEKKLFLVPVREAIIDSLNKTYGCFFRYKYKIDKLNSIPTIATTAILVTNGTQDRKTIQKIVAILDKNYKKLKFPQGRTYPKDHFLINPLSGWSDGVYTYARENGLLLESKESGRKYFTYIFLGAVAGLIILLLLILHIFKKTTLLHRYKNSSKIINFLKYLQETLVTHKYKSLAILFFSIYILFIVLLKYFEHQWALENNQLSIFDNKSDLDIFSWLFVFGSSGYNGDIFPNSEGGKVVASMVPLVGIGGLIVYAGLMTLDQFKKYFLEVNGMLSNNIKNHIVICGWNENSRYVVENLLHDNLDSKKQIVILANSVHEEEIKSTIIDPIRVFFVSGIATNKSDLEKIMIDKADVAIIVSDSTYKEDPDARVILKALTIKKFFKDSKKSIYTVAEIKEPSNIPIAQDAEVDQIVSLSNIHAKIFTQAINNPGVTKFINEIVTYNDDNDIYSFVIDKNSTLNNKTYDEILIALREHNILLLSINFEYKRSNEEIEKIKKEFGLTKSIITNPINQSEQEYRAQDGDLVIVLCQFENVLTEALKSFNI